MNRLFQLAAAFYLGWHMGRTALADQLDADLEPDTEDVFVLNQN